MADDRREDMRVRAARQASYGDYWAGKCVGLIDHDREAVAALNAAEAELRQTAAERDALRHVVRHFHDVIAASPERKGLPPMTEWEDGDWADSSWSDEQAAAIRAALADPWDGDR